MSLPAQAPLIRVWPNFKYYEVYLFHTFHSYRLPLLLCFSSNHTSVPLLHLNTYITVSVEVSVMTAGQPTDDSSKGTFICSVEWTLWKRLRLQLSVTIMIVAMTFWSMYMHRIDEWKCPLYTCTHAKSQPLLALLGLIVFGSELPHNLRVFKLCLSRLFSFCSMLLAPSRSGWAGVLHCPIRSGHWPEAYSRSSIRLPLPKGQSSIAAAAR